MFVDACVNRSSWNSTIRHRKILQRTSFQAVSRMPGGREEMGGAACLAATRRRGGDVTAKQAAISMVVAGSFCCAALVAVVEHGGNSIMREWGGDRPTSRARRGMDNSSTVPTFGDGLWVGSALLDATQNASNHSRYASECSQKKTPTTNFTGAATFLRVPSACYGPATFPAIAPNTCPHRFPRHRQHLPPCNKEKGNPPPTFFQLQMLPFPLAMETRHPVSALSRRHPATISP